MFYVYQLIDPRNGKPFYVGKGRGKRIDAHELQARNGTKSRKCFRIREIWDEKLTITKEIVKQFENETEAYQYEYNLIEQYGLANLTNVLPGGSGGYVRALRERTEAQKYAALDKLETYLDRINDLIERGFDLIFPIEHGKELAESYIDNLRQMVNDLRWELKIVAVITLPLEIPIKVIESKKKWASEPGSRKVDPRAQGIDALASLSNCLKPQRV